MATTGNETGSEESSREESKQTITPLERWLLITEKAYSRVQQRAYVGGDPFDDWLAAEREVDAKYSTDFRGPLADSDPDDLTEQVRTMFSGYGFGHLGLDALLEKHRVGLDKLAHHNRRVMESAAELAAQQSVVLQESVSGAVETLQALVHGKLSAEAVAKQAELSARAVQNVAAHLKNLAESVTGAPSSVKKDDGGA